MAPAQKEVRAVKTNRNEIQLAQLNMKVEEWPFQSLKNKLDATATAASLSVSKKKQAFKNSLQNASKEKTNDTQANFEVYKVDFTDIMCFAV